MAQADPNPEYWSEYSNLQRVKHELIKHYLDGWFPKLTLGPSRARRLMYIDTHAGRGKHLSGALGSPLVALQTLLAHQSLDKIVSSTEIWFYFIERDEENAAALREELTHVALPANVRVEAEAGDCFQLIGEAIGAMEQSGGQMAPSFVFVDPYGFKLPGNLLRRLLKYPKVELFINVIWRELDMAMRQVRSDDTPKKGVVRGKTLFDDMELIDQSAATRPRTESKASLEETLNSVFDGDSWKSIEASAADERADQCAGLFRSVTGARWGTHLRMLDNSRVRYFLLHLTNHDAGRDLMKQCMWQSCPHGGFSASKSDNPRQVVLIEAEPNLNPLRNWVCKQLSHSPKRWQELSERLHDELWLSKHLTDVIRSMRKNGEIVAEGFTGRFAQSNNPRLSLGDNLRDK